MPSLSASGHHLNLAVSRIKDRCLPIREAKIACLLGVIQEGLRRAGRPASLHDAAVYLEAFLPPRSKIDLVGIVRYAYRQIQLWRN